MRPNLEPEQSAERFLPIHRCQVDSSGHPPFLWWQSLEAPGDPVASLLALSVLNELLFPWSCGTQQNVALSSGFTLLQLLLRLQQGFLLQL